MEAVEFAMPDLCSDFFTYVLQIEIKLGKKYTVSSKNKLGILLIEKCRSSSH